MRQQALNQSENIRNKLVNLACEMIDKNNGSTQINMRAIAREAGCAHTNIYNYFESFNDLLYAAMFRAMELLVSFTQKHVGTRARTYEHFSDFINAQIQFAGQHKGLYRFIWLEKIPGTMPQEVKDFAKELKNRFADLVFNCSTGKLSKEEAMEISGILHSYLHGEICKMLNERIIEETEINDIAVKVRANVDHLMKLLISSKGSG